MVNRQKVSGATICLLATIAVASGSTAIDNKEATLIPNIESWIDPVRETSDNGIGVLIIPMIGQMGTDINAKLYEDLKEKMQDARPDLILIELDSPVVPESAGTNKLDYNSVYRYDPIVDLVKLFRIELDNVPQVLWIKKANDDNSTLTFAWDKVYMSPDATLRGTTDLAKMRWFYIKEGAHTVGKMREHSTAHIKNFANLSRPYNSEIGRIDRSAPQRHSELLGLSFVDPEVTLSGTWHGKRITWELGTEGDFILDGNSSRRGVYPLSASLCEELAISNATVTSRHDVLFSEGIREYYLVGQDVAAEVAVHRTNWRKDLERARKYVNDWAQYEGWATGDQRLYYLIKQLDRAKSLLRLMEKWPGLATRIGWEFELSVPKVEEFIKQLEKIIRQVRESEKDGRRGGGGRGGGRPIGPGGGGGR